MHMDLNLFINRFCNEYSLHIRNPDTLDLKFKVKFLGINRCSFIEEKTFKKFYGYRS